MNLHRQWFLVVLSLIFLLLVSSSVPVAVADQVTYTTIDLTPTWTTGIISDRAGVAGIVPVDLDQDGQVEIASCSNGYAYVLRSTGNEAYNTIWFSEYIGCKQITSADRDGDGVSELYVAAGNGHVWIFDAASYQVLGIFVAITYESLADIDVADVDGDGDHEIVLVRAAETLVYDANSYLLEWQAAGMGGWEAEVGNIDTDLLPEIVVNGYPAHVLNASLKIEEWVYSSGFGNHVSLGDVDHDNIDEIGYISSYDIYMLDGDTQIIKWVIDDFILSLSSITVVDVDGDGICEVIIGESQTGNVRGYRGSDGEELWSIYYPKQGISSHIAVGDVNDDGVNEILYGAGLTLSGQAVLVISDWQSESVIWVSDDLEGPLYVAAGDVDNDREGEVVLISSGTSGDYGGGKIRVYDGETHQLEWSTLIQQYSYDVKYQAVGQLDSDLPLEILVEGGGSYNYVLKSFDGETGLLEWQNPDLGALSALTVMNIDGDPIAEVFIACPSQNVQVYEGASNTLQWDSGALDGYIRDIAVGDLDGNGVADLAVVTTLSVYVYEVGTWTEKLHRPFINGRQVAIAEADINGGGELLLATSDLTSSLAETVQAWDGVSFATNWYHSLGDVVIADLRSADVDSDGVQEYIVMGNEGLAYNPKSMLWIGARGYPRVWEYQNPGFWGTINSMAMYDVDNDGETEFLFGSSHLIQVDELSTSSQVAHLAYLPFVRSACVPLYTDDFSNPASGWPVSDTVNVLYEYNNGEYRMLVRTTNWGAGARPGFQASDYILSVDLRNPNNVYGSYGLAFGIASDWSSFYTLEIYPDGWYGIYRFDPSQVVTLDTAYSPSINQGSASNHIEVERSGASIKAYANGQLLTSITDGTYLGSRYMGLVVFSYSQPNVDIRFDNFVVNPISCSGSTTGVGYLGSDLSLLDQFGIGMNMIDMGIFRDR